MNSRNCNTLCRSIWRLGLLLVVSIFPVFPGSEASAETEKPNIIFILADDLGYSDLGIMGHPYAKSPNIDLLAREGIRFTNAYMAAAWCSPSRYALMSGVFPAREFTVTHLLRVDQPNIGRLLRDSGYATAHYGKWHMGDHRQDAPPPYDYGFEESFSTQSSGPTWPAEARRDPHYREKTTPYYINLAIDFIERNRNESFYINLWLYPTHSYINPTPEQLAVYDDLEVDINDFGNPLQRDFLKFVSLYGDVEKAMRAYCSDVTALDKEVGRLLRKLEDLGLEKDTIVIFSSDNGAGPVSNNWDDVIRRYKERPTLLNNVGSSGPFRERKSSMYEGGTRVPFIVRWPGKIPGNTVDDRTILGGVDYFPTLASLVGLGLQNY